VPCVRDVHLDACIKATQKYMLHFEGHPYPYCTGHTVAVAATRENRSKENSLLFVLVGEVQSIFRLLVFLNRPSNQIPIHNHYFILKQLFDTAIDTQHASLQHHHCHLSRQHHHGLRRKPLQQGADCLARCNIVHQCGDDNWIVRSSSCHTIRRF
jgi:hypothetical protein